MLKYFMLGHDTWNLNGILAKGAFIDYVTQMGMNRSVVLLLIPSGIFVWKLDSVSDARPTMGRGKRCGKLHYVIEGSSHKAYLHYSPV